MMRFLLLITLWLPTHLVWAHHSYGDYDRNERYELHGTLKEIHWANPHIVFIVDTGEHLVRVEWITVNGAERIGTDANLFQTGDEFVVIGSRHRDPNMLVLTVIKEMRLPQKGWEWITPLARYYKNNNMDDDTP